MYVLADTQSFRDKMRGIEQIMKDLEIDPDIGKMRSAPFPRLFEYMADLNETRAAQPSCGPSLLP